MEDSEMRKSFYILYLISFWQVGWSLKEEFMTKAVESTGNIVHTGTGNESQFVHLTKEVTWKWTHLIQLFTTTMPDNGVMQHTPEIVTRYGINTGYCESRSVCGNSKEIYLDLLGRNCQCDQLCSIFDDCCEDIAEQSRITRTSLEMRQFECVFLRTRDSNAFSAADIVTKCSREWKDDVTSDLCKDQNKDSALIVNVPVSDVYGITYRNMYCAYCNFMYAFHFWTVEQKCVNQTDTATCDLFVEPLLNFSKKCRQQDYISNCSNVANTTLVKMCAQSPVLSVYTFRENPFDDGIKYLYTKYKNKYCAMCNNADESLLVCFDDAEASGGGGTSKPPIYSFRLLVDFNALLRNENRHTFACKNNEIYDPVSQTCRQIFCPKTTVNLNGRCLPDVSTDQHNQDECVYVRLESTEWEFENNNTSIFVPSLSRTFNSSMFKINGSDLYLCLDAYLNDTGTNDIGTLFYISSAESYMSLCGLVLSISALIITIFVYCMFPDLLNLPGKTLTCFMVSLLLAQILFLCLGQAVPNSATCKALAILVHYFYLASFTWENVIVFDLLSTFSRPFVAATSSKTKSKRFYFYNMYGWLLPLTIVGIAIGFDLSYTDITNEFKPNYGDGICWIASRNALIVFFAGPLALFKFVDAIGFALTSCFIARAGRHGSKARNEKLCTFILYIKLSVVMGLTWVFAFLAMFTSNIIMWYTFIIFNTSQGFFIALCFLWTGKVKKLVREKFSRHLSQSSFTGTTRTSM